METLSRNKVKIRIVDQFKYCEEVWNSDRPLERKQELITSALSVVLNLFSMYPDMEMGLLLISLLTSFTVRVSLPSNHLVADVQVGHAIIGEDGMELHNVQSLIQNVKLDLSIYEKVYSSIAEIHLDHSGV